MTSELSAALAGELSGVFGALLDTPIVTTPTDSRPTGRHWRATIKSDNAAHGVALVCIDEVGATALAAQIMGLTEPPPDASTQDTLQEALTQALSSTTFKEVTHGVLLRVVKLELTDDELAEPVAACTFEAAGLAAPVIVAFGGALDLSAAEAVAAADAAAHSTRHTAVVPDSPADRIDVILDIDLPLIVRGGAGHRVAADVGRDRSQPVGVHQADGARESEAGSCDERTRAHGFLRYMIM